MITWKNVLDCKAWYGHITAMAETAKRAGYEYFVWNDRLYRFTDEEKTNWRDEGVVRDHHGLS